MIGLPVVSSMAGFIPSSLAMLGCYLFTTLTGLLLLEATLWFDQKVNLLSLADFALGKAGKLFTWILFLSLFYCLFVAYIDGIGQLITDCLSAVCHQSISRSLGIILCVVFATLMTAAGTRMVAGLNRYLLIGLVVSYVLLVLLGLPSVKLDNLQVTHWNSTLATVPVLLICFGYQNLVPSLAYYLKRNVRALRLAIIIGNLLPFFIYLLWNGVILGILADYTHFNQEQVQTVTALLEQSSGANYVLAEVKAFSFFAILTSFLPSAISFMDFLQDGLQTRAGGKPIKNTYLYALVFVPPLLCSLMYPNLFLQALGFAGGFIDVLLFGVLPACVVLIGRQRQTTASYQVVGGRFTPYFVLIISFGVLLYKTRTLL